MQISIQDRLNLKNRMFIRDSVLILTYAFPSGIVHAWFYRQKKKEALKYIFGSKCMSRSSIEIPVPSKLFTTAILT